MIEKLKSTDKFLVCTDSKTEALDLFNEMADDTVKVYTSDTVVLVDIEGFDKVIISPKVITGVDSKMKRPVFCLYHSHTITPKHMVQQVNRCRNIEHIYYHFIGKRFNMPLYLTVDDVYAQIDREDKLVDFEMLVSDAEYKCFRTILADTMYEHDCMATNKFLHFKKILRSRGVIDVDRFYTNIKESQAQRSDVIAVKLANFDTEKLKPQVCVDFEGDEAYRPPEDTNNPIQDILNIPFDRIDDFKEYFVDEIKLENHFNTCDFFFKKNEVDKLKKYQDFNVKKATSTAGKMSVVREMCKTFGVSLESGEVIKCTKKVKRSVSDAIASKFTTSFRYRGKKLDFSDDYIVAEKIATSLKHLCGKTVVDTKRAGKKKIATRTLSNKFIQNEKELFEFRSDVVVKESEDMNISDKLRKKIFKT